MNNGQKNGNNYHPLLVEAGNVILRTMSSLREARTERRVDDVLDRMGLKNQHRSIVADLQAEYSATNNPYRQE